MSVDINMWDLLNNSAVRHPNKPALKQGDTCISYGQLRDRVCRIAGFIRSKGLTKGDKIAVLSPNSAAFVETMFANSKLGVITELLNWRLAPARLAELIENSDAKMLFFSSKCTAEYLYLNANITRAIQFICMDDCMEGIIGSNELYLAEPDSISADGPSFNDPAILIYSSGTTSKPKAMLHSTKGFTLKAFISARAGGWSSDEVYLLTSPLFHSSCIGLFTCIYVGATCILGDPSVDGLIHAIAKEHATRVGVVPSVLNRILDYVEAHPEIDCSSVRSIEYGAAPMTVEQIERSMKYFSCGFYQYYGMTETAATVTVLLPEHHMDPGKLNSVGLPVLGTRIKIVRADGSECMPNEHGEVVVSHPCTISEYIDNPELTASAIHGMWYFSGDIGYLDEDGFLFLVDRKSDLIITGGENVYPKEVAGCIMSMDGIKDAAVTGVPDDLFGEAIIAAVVKKSEYNITQEDIQAYCKQHMASYKKPRYVYFVDELPLNPTGKFDKHALKKLHLSKHKAL